MSAITTTKIVNSNQFKENRSIHEPNTTVVSDQITRKEYYDHHRKRLLSLKRHNRQPVLYRIFSFFAYLV